MDDGNDDDDELLPRPLGREGDEAAGADMRAEASSWGDTTLCLGGCGLAGAEGARGRGVSEICSGS